MATTNVTAENVFATVKNILEETYGGNENGVETSATFVAEEIAKLVTKETKTVVEYECLCNEVLHLVWNNYANGDTARSVRRRIFAELGL